MNRISNPLLMIVPFELLGLLLGGMIMLGGFFIMISATQKGKAIIITALLIPIAAVVVQAMMESFFATLPEDLVWPVYWFIMVIIYAAMGVMLARMLFGKKTITEWRNRMLVSILAASARFLFKWPVMLLWLGGLLYLFWAGKFA